jgi:hypothetical protein
MIKKPNITVDFVDFWPNFVKNDNYFYHLLSQEYDVIITENKPDLLFHSVDYCRHQGHKKYNNSHTKKIYYSGEPPHIHRPDYNESHFSFTFEDTADARNYRLPLWVLHLNWFNVPHSDDRDQSYLHSLEELLKPKDAEYLWDTKKEFCSFINTQPFGRRVEFVPKLNQKQFVHCAGRLYNNVNGNIIGRGDQRWKIEYLKQFKFNIGMENCDDCGYVSEKIIHGMFANCIPIYWGSDVVIKDFNFKSFINWHDFNNDEENIEKIMEINTNKIKYCKIMSEPWFYNNEIPINFQPKTVLNFINERILNNAAR